MNLTSTKKMFEECSLAFGKTEETRPLLEYLHMFYLHAERNGKKIKTRDSMAASQMRQIEHLNKQFLKAKFPKADIFDQTLVSVMSCQLEQIPPQIQTSFRNDSTQANEKSDQQRQEQLDANEKQYAKARQKLAKDPPRNIIQFKDQKLSPDNIFQKRQATQKRKSSIFGKIVWSQSTGTDRLKQLQLQKNANQVSAVKYCIREKGQID